MDWAGFIARCTWKIFEMITKINYQFIWKGKSKCLKLPPIYILETLANPTLRLGHLSLMCVNIYALTQAHQTEIDYMCPGQSIFSTEVSFSARWGSPADITLTVCKKKKGVPTNKPDSGYVWAVGFCCFWNHVQSWQILDCMSGGDWNTTAPFLNMYLLSLHWQRKKKKEANRGNKLSMACFNILMTVWELPLMTTLRRIWNILLLQIDLFKFGSFFDWFLDYLP